MKILVNIDKFKLKLLFILWSFGFAVGVCDFRIAADEFSSSAALWIVCFHSEALVRCSGDERFFAEPDTG